MAVTPPDSPETSTGVMVNSGTVAQLTRFVIPPPAPDPTQWQIRAQVWILSRGYGSDPAGQPEDIHRGQAARRRVVAQLASEVISPAHDPTRQIRAQVWVDSAAMAVIPLDSPETSTGVRRFVVVPSPSVAIVVIPPALDPTRGRSAAQVWSYPAAMAVTPLDSPETSTGVSAVRRRAVAQLTKVSLSPST